MPLISSWFYANKPKLVHFVRTIGLVLLITFISKIIGFAREVLISYQFGVSNVTDVFFSIQQIPIFITSFMFGAFNLAFIPCYSVQKEAGLSGQFFDSIKKLLFLIGLLLTAIFWSERLTLAPLIVGLPETTFALGISFSKILSLSIVPIIFSGLAYGLLHAEQKHFLATIVAALSPFLMVATMLVLFFVPSVSRVTILPWSFTAGTAITAFFCLYILGRLRYKLGGSQAKSTTLPVWSSLKPFVKSLSLASLENAGFNFNQMLNIYFAGTTGLGGVAANSYALRIAMLPLSGLISPLNQIFQTWFSKSVGEPPKLYRRAIIGLATILVLSCMIAVGISFFSTEIVSIIYQRGAFSRNDTTKVAVVVIPYSAYFCVMAGNQMLARYYFAVQKGANYTYALLVGYLIANSLKLLLTTQHGLPGVIWACVIGEGAAFTYLVLNLLLRKPEKCFNSVQSFMS